MADLASSFTAFLFPEEYQPLDGCEEEIQLETLINTKRDCNDGAEDRTVEGDASRSSCVSFKEPFTLDTCTSLKLDFDHETNTDNMDTQEQENSPTTPSKPTEHHLPCLSPLTPTANLKILISAASPEIRVLDSKRQKKALFEAIPDHASSLQEQELDTRTEGLQEIEIECSSQGEEGCEDGDKPINRKSKSLGLLCQRFLSKYPDYPENGLAVSVSLDEVSKDLGVERRRIYDIVNVLESIEMVSRVAKNKYLWHGKINVDSTLARLKCLGRKRRYADQIDHLRRLQIQNGFYDEMENASHQPFRDISNLGNPNQDSDDKKELDKFDEDTNNRRDKSLGIMSQKFIMLFLVSEAKVITLDIAARVLIGDINYEIREGSKFKTKVRRLYDIANILTSLNMIKKVHVYEGRSRKPAFSWIGPDPDTSHLDPSNVSEENNAPSRQSFFSTPADPLPNARQQDSKTTQASHSKSSAKRTSWSRHASFNAICEVAERERRSYSSAPNSPVKDSREEFSSDTQIDEKFRQDFEALRSKYPDQMSKIYVSKNSRPEEQKENITSSNPRSSIAVPVSTPKGTTLANTAHIIPLNPKVIVSPIPGSVPVGSSRRISDSIAIPLTFNVMKSNGSFIVGSQDGLPNSTNASVPSSSPSDILNQPVSDEFEYRPTTKRRKLEQKTAVSLQLSHPQGTQYLNLPINSGLVHPRTGKPLQTVLIRREVSVLDKSPNGPPSILTGEQIKDGKRQIFATQPVIIPSEAASRKTLRNHHKEPGTTLSSTPKSTSNSIQRKNSPELICTENLVDEVIIEQTGLEANHCIGQLTEQEFSEENTNKAGLKLDKSKIIKETGIQRERKITDVNTKRSPWQRKHPCRQKHFKRHNRRSVARALHLCPEFRQGPSENPESRTKELISVSSAEELKRGGENGTRQVYKDNASKTTLSDKSAFRSNVEKGSFNFGLKEIRKDFNNDHEDLAWPLHNLSQEPAQKEVSKKTAPSKPEQLQAPWSGLPHESLKSSFSLPCSPFSSLDLNGGRGLSPDNTIYKRPRSLSSLGICETSSWPSIRSLSIPGRDLMGSPVLFERFGPVYNTYKAPTPRKLLLPDQPSDLSLGWHVLHQRGLNHQTISPVPFLCGTLEAPGMRAGLQGLSNMNRHGSPALSSQCLYNGRMQHSQVHVFQERQFQPLSVRNRSLSSSLASGQYLPNPRPQSWNLEAPSPQQSSSKTCVSPFLACTRLQSTPRPDTALLPGMPVIMANDRSSCMALQGRQLPRTCQRSTHCSDNPCADTSGVISGNGLVQVTVSDGIKRY